MSVKRCGRGSEVPLLGCRKKAEVSRTLRYAAKWGKNRKGLSEDLSLMSPLLSLMYVFTLNIIGLSEVVLHVFIPSCFIFIIYTRF